MEVLNIFNEEQLKVLEKNDFLIPLIKNELVKNNIKDIALDEEEISKIKYEFMQANKIKNDSEFSKWLIDNNTTEDEVRSSLYDKEYFTNPSSNMRKVRDELELTTVEIKKHPAFRFLDPKGTTIS